MPLFLKRIIVKAGAAMIDAMTDLDINGQLAQIVEDILKHFESLEIEKELNEAKIKDLNEERKAKVAEVYASYEKQLNTLYEKDKVLKEQTKEYAKKKKEATKVLG